MGCRSDYMEQHGYEKQISETIEHLIYVHTTLNIPITPDIREAAKERYFDEEDGDKWVEMLCTLLSSLGDKEIDSVVYNAKSKESRRLADWWEEHQAADIVRLKKEKLAIIKGALAKLTDEEIEALGLKQ